MWPRRLKKIPAVKKVMTPFPFHVEVTEPLDEVLRLMATEGIHHLPVMDAGSLVGVINHRDLERTAVRARAGETRATVADVPREEAYVVSLSEPLDRVLMEMAERRLGATLVVKKGRLAGIFTHTDACRCLAESLRQQFPPRGDNEVA